MMKVTWSDVTVDNSVCLASLFGIQFPAAVSQNGRTVCTLKLSLTYVLLLVPLLRELS